MRAKNVLSQVLFLAALALVITFTGACAVVPQVPQAQEMAQEMEISKEAPRADRPTWAVGSWWRYEGKADGKPYNPKYRFIGVETVDGEKLLVVGSENPKYSTKKEYPPVWPAQPEFFTRSYYTEDLNRYFTKDSKGEIYSMATPAIAYFQWPLVVGKRWTQRITITSFPGRTTHDNEQEFKVLSYEKVKVSAGEFEVFRIIRYAVAVPSGNKLNEEYWYSPGVKNVVRRVIRSARRNSDWSLAGYELK